MRRILLAALCALFLVALTAQAAFAASVTSDGTTATYTGDADTDDIDLLHQAASTIRFNENDGDPITPSGSCVAVDADTVDCTAEAAVVNAGDGEDVVDGKALTVEPIMLDGGSGDDTLTGGGADDDITAGSGSDFVSDDDGKDRVDLGSGDDHVLFVFGGDEVIGGTGVDRVLFLSIDPMLGIAPVSFSLNDVADDGGASEGTNIHSDVEDVVDFLTLINENIGSYSDTPPAESPTTLRGTSGPNTLMGGAANDDIDGGDGNDSLVGGEGDDTIRSIDGYADRVACSPGGNDTANVDTLDIVSDTCENRNVTDVGNANDVPEVPEDLPPTVTFDAPPAGALTTGPNTLAATATDDRGISSVLFLDDDRIVCTDTVAPYTCDYQPRGEDVGRNTLSVMAVDTAQQTATAFRAFTVPRFAPAAFSIRVTPRRDTRAPFRFAARGGITLPSQVVPALGCRGAFVAVQVKAGGTTISNRRVRLRDDCSYRSTVSFRSRRRFRTRRALRVYAVFAGNEVLAPLRTSVVNFRVR